jgi:tRNA threonylcarbamoyladenosine biosynthesis protein TsaB
LNLKILSVETSAISASVAVCEDNNILGEFFNNTHQTHSQTLMPMVQALLSNCKIAISDIDAFAVSVGPGSFTGVRIGVSAVKGMAMVHSKKCIAVSTLEAIAHNLKGQNCIACAVMDARCSQVYNALFDVTEGSISRITEDRALSINDLKKEFAKYNKNIILVGDGAKLCYNYMQEIQHVFVAPEHLLVQRASEVGLLGAEYLNNGISVQASELVPFYLRLPQAERELNNKNSKINKK